MKELADSIERAVREVLIGFGICIVLVISVAAHAVQQSRKARR